MSTMNEKRRVGRPKKDNPRLTNLGGVRLNDEELGELQEAASLDTPEVSFADWVRNLCFGRAKEIRRKHGRKNTD